MNKILNYFFIFWLLFQTGTISIKKQIESKNKF